LLAKASRCCVNAAPREAASYARIAQKRGKDWEAAVVAVGPLVAARLRVKSGANPMKTLASMLPGESGLLERITGAASPRVPQSRCAESAAMSLRVR
jgi:hypothetical protein